ncbi:hypothetical protein GGX14DRAFT_402517 [Mycena pura]|uniref:Uncharacterized protein n=1 Tax=Mycena pura TaxID=153505 RepID=A0AAD6UXP1_9AGAR|nr:hypothetical protein GGX14DRAFT_402517 [Mycena pura]
MFWPAYGKVTHSHGATPPAAAPACLRSNAAPQAPAFGTLPVQRACGSVRGVSCLTTPPAVLSPAAAAALQRRATRRRRMLTGQRALAFDTRSRRRAATALPRCNTCAAPPPDVSPVAAAALQRRPAAALQLRWRVATPVTPAPRHRPRGAGACAESVLTPDGDPVLTLRDTRRKDTHLHRAKGDSRLFDGTAWYLQSGVRLSGEVVASPLGNKGRDSGDDEPQLLAGYSRSQRAPKRLRDIAPDDVVVEGALSSDEVEDSDVEMSPSKQGKPRRKSGKRKAKKDDGWIWKWLERGTRAGSGDDGKLEEYKRESMRVQWFRAEAEMYRWLEQYERKHAELWRIIKRYRRDGEVWMRSADRVAQQMGAATFARMQAAMYRRLEHNAKAIFKSADSATTYDELVMKIDTWRDLVLKWMDEMDIHRAYKEFYKDS